MPALPKPYNAHESGLTLVEVLVVLTILAVMAGATVLAIGTGAGSRGTADEARRLAARLRLAADDVRIDQRRLAFAWDRRGYGFVDWDAKAQKWQADPVEELARHELPSGMMLEGKAESGTVPVTPDGTGGAIDVRLGTADAGWKVHFDGLDAVATVS